MAQVTPNMQLTVWNNPTDPYDSGQLADNFVKIDLHNHDGSKGIKLNAATSIVDDSISAKQIGGNAVGSAELQSDANDPGNDDLRAVSNDHIKNSTITGSKIADRSITKYKLGSGSTNPDIVYHRSDWGSFPTVTVTNQAPLYDGYTIDYCFDLNITSGSSGGGYYTNSASLKTDANYDNYFWRFRYNLTRGGWDFIGGMPIILSSSYDLLYTNPTASSFYTVWPSRTTPANKYRMQTFTMPFQGRYDVTASGTGDLQGNISGLFRSALYFGGYTTNAIAQNSIRSDFNSPGLVGGNGDESWSATRAAGIASTDSDAVTATSSNIPLVVGATANAANSANILRQVFGIAGASGTPDVVLRQQKLVIRPFRNLNNFSS